MMINLHDFNYSANCSLCSQFIFPTMCLCHVFLIYIYLKITWTSSYYCVLARLAKITNEIKATHTIDKILKRHVVEKINYISIASLK